MQSPLTNGKQYAAARKSGHLLVGFLQHAVALNNFETDHGGPSLAFTEICSSED